MKTLEAFKINSVDGIPMLTLLVESLNARNAHWVKEEVLHYLHEKRPKGLFLNLQNLKHLGHIGLGALIAINNQLRSLKPHAFVGIGPEVEQMLHHSHLDQLFHVWEPSQPCPICQAAGCSHRSELLSRIQEFPAREYPVDESRIPHLNEMVEHLDLPAIPLVAAPVNSAKARTARTPARTARTPARMRPEDLPDAGPDLDVEPIRQGRGLRWLGLATASLVVLLLIGVGGWYTVSKYASSGYTRVIPVSTEVRLDAYDMNGDGRLTREDLPLMSETQRSNLTFTTYCRELGLACKSPD